MRKAKREEIKVWYKFKLTLNIWFTKMNGKSYIISLPDETWYDGYCFNTGYFIFIQCKYFAIHVMFKWWNINI